MNMSNSLSKPSNFVADISTCSREFLKIIVLYDKLLIYEVSLSNLSSKRALSHLNASFSFI